MDHPGVKPGFLAILLAAPLAAQPVRITPLRGEALTLDNWTLAEERLRGTLTETGERFSISARRVWLLEPRTAPPPPAAEGGAFLQLRGGPLLYGKLVGGNGNDFVFELRFGGRSKVAKTFLQGVQVGEAPAKGASDAGFARALAAPPADEDYLYGYDAKGRIRRYRCKVAGMDDQELLVELDGTTVKVPLGNVFGLVFAETSGLEASPPSGRGLVTVTLHDGRVLQGTARGAGWNRPFGLRLPAGMDLAVPLDRIREVEFGSDKLLYLSTLPPSESSSQKPAFGRTWPILRDRGLGGGPLRLGPRRYRRGFLLVPEVRLDFELPREFNRLEGEVGMPRSRYGSVRLRILADGRQLGEAVELTADGTPLPLSRELAGARRVTIQLEATDDLDVGALVVLGDLRVVVE